MYGDFSRDSFDPSKQYTRVLMQQGRPLTDADWNEQASLLIHEQREFVRSVLGWHGTFDDGFRLMKKSDSTSLELSAGNYFVDGLRCANPCPHSRPIKDLIEPISGKTYCVYVDVWESSILPVQDSELLEPALGGIDTACRGRLQWAVRVHNKPLASILSDNREGFYQAIDKKGKETNNPVLCALRQEFLRPNPSCCNLREVSTGGLAGSALYRVEVHRSGMASKGVDGKSPTATFKWSRVNGTCLLRLKESEPKGSILTVSDDSQQLLKSVNPGDLLELIYGSGRSYTEDGNLLRVISVNQADSKITVASAVVKASEKWFVAESSAASDDKVIFARKWEPTDSSLNAPADKSFPGEPIVIKGTGIENDWQTLGDGIRIRFNDSKNVDRPFFNAGDYWLIRSFADGNLVVWPSAGNACHPHHYAPLAFLNVVDSSNLIIDYISAWKQFWVFGTPNHKPSPDDCDKPIDCDKKSKQSPSPAEGPASSEKCCGAKVTAASHSPSILSSAGKQALKKFLNSPQGLTRRIPARYLNHETKSSPLRKWLRTALVSEIHEPTFEKFLEKVLRSVQPAEIEQSVFNDEIREVYELAMTLREQLSTGTGLQQLIG